MTAQKRVNVNEEIHPIKLTALAGNTFSHTVLDNGHFHSAYGVQYRFCFDGQEKTCTDCDEKINPVKLTTLTGNTFSSSLHGLALARRSSVQRMWFCTGPGSTLAEGYAAVAPALCPWAPGAPATVYCWDKKFALGLSPCDLKSRRE